MQPNSTGNTKKVLERSEWHEFLKNLTDSFDMFFSDQFSEAADLLSSEEFEILFNGLECGIIEALKYLKNEYYNNFICH